MELKKRSQRTPRPPPPEDVYPKVPSDVGKELMASGWFGSNPNDLHGSKLHRRDLSTKLMQRQLGAATEQRMRSILQVWMYLFGALGLLLADVDAGFRPRDRQ